MRRIGPVSLAVRNRAEALQLVLDMVARQEGGAVAFANQHTINMACRDAKVARMMDRSLVFNDGVAIDVASKILFGESFPDNLNGTDFTPQLLAALPPTRIFLLGSKPGVADTALEILAAQYPQHDFVGAHHGFERGEAWLPVVERIRARDTQLLLLGMGHPYQDHWALDHGGALKAVILSIGAFLDFTAGVVPRAPDWVRRTRLEWAYRLMREPRRMFGRYITGGAIFGLHIARQKMAGGANKVSKGN